MTAIHTTLADTVISGYVDTSAHWDLGTGNGNPPAYSYNAGKQDGFNLNVVKLSLDRPLTESAWAAGYKVDLLFGPNANALGTQSSGAAADFAVQQAYVVLRAPAGNGLDVKVGVFDPMVGYEGFDAGGNANYTRSYAYTLEPTTQTGVLLSYDCHEQVRLSVGIANTIAPTINARSGVPGNSRAESYKTYMGSVAFSAPEEWGWLAGATFYGGVINGFDTQVVGSFNQTTWYVGATIPTPVDGWSLGVAYDYIGIHGGGSSSLPGGSSAYANAVALYSSVQCTERLGCHVRAEYFSRSPFEGGVIPGNSFIPGYPPSKALAITGTLSYDLWKNVISRLEFRWDHAADGDNHFGGSSGILGGGGPTRQNAYLLAANFIYQF